MPIYKASIEIVVLLQTDNATMAEDLLAQALENGSLLSDMIDGEFIGSHLIRNVAPVPPAKVVPELVAVGNNGTFFDDKGET